jgi:hypothetical protein
MIESPDTQSPVPMPEPRGPEVPYVLALTVEFKIDKKPRTEDPL